MVVGPGLGMSSQLAYKDRTSKKAVVELGMVIRQDIQICRNLETDSLGLDMV